MSEKDIEQVIVNRYKLLKKIGDGGMGNIYLAEDLQLSRQVAVKTIRSELKDNIEVQKRIDRECNLHATLGVHPNIVALHDRIDEDGSIYLIMEYIKGETLTARVKRNLETGAKFSTDEIIQLTVQVLDALAHIHSSEILHRDIKPSNIMLVDKGNSTIAAKLMDFGIAALDNNNPETTQLTTLMTGGPGTPAYMAPERIDSETYGESSPATDLYSVGVILYELLGGFPPFEGTMTEIFTGHLAREPNLAKISADVSDDLLSVLRKSLEKKQKERFQQAEEFIGTLQGCYSTSQTNPYGSPHNTSLDQTVLATGQNKQAILGAISQAQKEKSKGKHPTLWAVLLVAIIIGGGAVGGYFYLMTPQAEKNVETATISKQAIEENGGLAEKDSSLPAKADKTHTETTVTVADPLPEPIPQTETKVFSLDPINSPDSLPTNYPSTSSPVTVYNPSATEYVVPKTDENNGGDALDALNKFRNTQKSQEPAKTSVVATQKETKKPKKDYKKPKKKSTSGWIKLEDVTRKL